MTRVTIFILVLLTLGIYSCRKDSFNTSDSFRVEFSRDTILFDTVFTTVGSATQVFKIYNPDENESVELNYVSLAEGSSSKFRLNVDGESGARIENVEIAPSDSVFVFVEVTIDQSSEALPFIVEEDLLVNANGTDQTVQLAAWGQNAIFHTGSSIRISLEGEVEFDGYLECGEVWNNDFPHVIYGGAVGVAPGCCLTINPGTQVHVHSGSGILVDRGCIESNGTLGNEVVFQGDRLEFEYEDLPGQWGIELDFIADLGIGPEIVTVTRGGIWLLEAQPSFLKHTVIKNGVIGLQVDTTGAGADDVMVLENTVIRNHSAIGVLGQGATMSGYNNLFVNCGQTAAAFQFGGEYRFDHTTFANYWTQGTRQAPAFVLNNHFETTANGFEETIIRSLGNSRFRNCTFYGDNNSLTDFNEFIVDVEMPETEFYVFENCFLDTDNDLSDQSKYVNIINQEGVNPFINPVTYDFRPSFNSPLRNEASILGGELCSDLVGELRCDGESPDIGCLEFTAD